MGLILAFVAMWGYIWREHDRLGILFGILNFVAIIVVGYIWGRRMAESKGEEGFPFGKAFSFLLVIMLFAGFISGLGNYILQGVIDPAYYRELIENSLNKSGLGGNFEAVALYFNNPLIIILNGILTLICQGGLVSLVIAALVKKAPNPFSGGNTL